MKNIFIVFILVIFLINFISAEEFGYNYLSKQTSSSLTIYNTNITSFLDLNDTPASYTGDAEKCVKVNAGETGLEFVACAGGGDFSFSDFQTSWTSNWTALDLQKYIYNHTATANSTIYNTYSSLWVGSGGNFYYDNFTNSWDSNWTAKDYDKWMYNQSDFPISYLNSTYGIYWYNHTLIANNTIYNLYNDLWISTYNATYALYSYNHTLFSTGITSEVANNTYVSIGSSNLTTLSISNITNFDFNYNETSAIEGLYSKWFYNQSDFPISYLNSTYGIYWYNMSDGVGSSSSLWATNGTNIYNASVSQVGIGTATPLYPFHILKSHTGILAVINNSADLTSGASTETLLVQGARVGANDIDASSTSLHIVNPKVYDQSDGVAYGYGIKIDGGSVNKEYAGAVGYALYAEAPVDTSGISSTYAGGFVGNVTMSQCIIFGSGGSICSGS